jgi:tRNA threonylcarbamoyl adenosine modification protein YeaZ
MPFTSNTPTMARSALYLSLDTATPRSSLALGAPGARVPDAIIASRNDLSRLLGNVVRDLCLDRGIEPGDIGGIIIADGPGSFTGLRIGAAFAKGLHDACGAPLFAAPSLLGAAWMAGTAAGVVVAEYDALRGDVYRAIYDFGKRGNGATGERVRTLMAAELVPAEAPPPIHQYSRADERNASAAALLALMGADGGPARIAEPGSWQPDYGRPAEAEARRLARDAQANR